MKKKNAFTLAEVLITLGIIGIVAAMTLPALVQKYRNQVVETRLKKFYSAMNQAVKMAEVDYGDKKIWYQDLYGLAVDSEGNPIEGSSNVDIWFQKYLAPYLKIVNKKILADGRPTYYFSDGSALAVVHENESREERNQCSWTGVYRSADGGGPRSGGPSGQGIRRQSERAGKPE